MADRKKKRVETQVLKAIERTGGRQTASDVYESLRTSILSGRLKPGSILSQLQLSRTLKVSRTPIREAMRMLQEGGLVVGEPNFRARVLDFDPKEIEALYMKRISLEALGVAITAEQMTPEVSASLRRAVDSLEGKEAHTNFDRWSAMHRGLHSLMVSATTPAFVSLLQELELRSERYQSLYKGEIPVAWWQRGEAEHRAICEAMVAGEAHHAAELSARHTARTGLELLAILAPEHDTSAVRASLRFAISGATAWLSGKKSGSARRAQSVDID
jgi:DNA-binding GntR family transcriptional regulator